MLLAELYLFMLGKLIFKKAYDILIIPVINPVVIVATYGVLNFGSILEKHLNIKPSEEIE